MIGPAFVLFLAVSIVLIWYLLTCEKADKISALIGLLATIAISVKFYLFPYNYNLAVALPFIYFLPIVLALAVIIKKGPELLIESIFAIIVGAVYTWFTYHDFVILAGYIFMLFPPMIILGYIAYNRGFRQIYRVALSFVFLLILISLELIGQTRLYVIGSFLLALFFIWFIYKFGDDLRERRDKVKLSKFQLELNRKLTHSLVFLVFLPEWVLEYITDVGINFGLASFLGVDLNITSEALGMSYVRIGAIILLGSILPVFLTLEILRIKGGIAIVSEKLLREGEENQIAGYVWIVIGVLTIATFFELNIFRAGTAVAFIADAFAALVGIKFGVHRITPRRSVEGTITGFISAFLSAYIFVGLIPALIVALVIEIVDVIVDGYASDNVIFPIVAGVTLWLVT